MILFALLGLPQGDATAAMQRFESYMAKVKTFSVNLNVTYNGHAVGKASLKFSKPGRMAFNMTGQQLNVGFALNEKNGLEVDRSEKLYDAYDARGKFFVPNSRMSGVIPISIPRFILDGSLKAYVPANTKLTLTPKQPVGGASTDLVQGYFEEPTAKMWLKVWIDPAGKILKFSRKIESQEGTTTIAYDFSNYAANPTIAPEAFSTRLPLGYTPYDLARSGAESVEIGQPLPMGSFVSAGSGQSVGLKSLIADRNGLVLVTDPEFPSNPELLTAVKDLAKQVPDSQIVIIGNRKDVASTKRIAKDALYDPTGKEIAKLRLPGTPTLYLLNKKGVVVQAFFGFDGKWEGLEDALKRLKG